VIKEFPLRSIQWNGYWNSLTGTPYHLTKELTNRRPIPIVKPLVPTDENLHITSENGKTKSGTNI
jgi:hypothetical protein